MTGPACHCGSTATVRHCTSPTCRTWFVCQRCGDWFDPLTGSFIRKPRKHKPLQEGPS